MSTAVHQIRASYAFVERNINLVKRYWTWELVWMVYSIANSLSVSFIGLGMEYLGGSNNVDGQFLVLYLVIGTLVWRYLSTIFYWITEIISIERWEGTIEYTLMAPIVETITRHQGTVYKFIGFAVMAYLNVPIVIEYHADKAVVTALQQFHQLNELTLILK